MNNNAANTNPLEAIASTVFNTKNEAFILSTPSSPTELPTKLRDIVLEKLVNFFIDEYRPENPKAHRKSQLAIDLNKILKETGAIVSGGFILKALGLYPEPIVGEIGTPSDVDIYVSCSNVVRLYEKLGVWMGAEDVRSYKQSKYCSSFLKRNGIRRVYTFTSRKELPTRRGRSRVVEKVMDIMSVRNARDLKDVVKNFDLTFCMNWYDGEKLYSWYPKHLDHKIGFLQGDYVKMFLGGNRFLKARLNKYIQRKFEIRLDPEIVKSEGIHLDASRFLAFCKKAKPERDEAFYYTWASKALFEFLFTKKYSCYNVADNVNGLLRLRDFPKNPIFEDDGYDSDEYTLSSPNDPAKDTVMAKFVEIAKRKAEVHDATLATLEPEEKFWQLVTRCISYFYSNSVDKPSPFLENYGERMYKNNENLALKIEERYFNKFILQNRHIKKYLESLKSLFVRIGMDPVTLDDVQVYDFHAHKLDQGASKDTIDGLLKNNVAISNKDEIPCYLPPEECGRYLTRNDVRPFASPDVFTAFVSNRPPVQKIPLGELTDWGVLLRNEARSTDSWGAINKQTMCPFCMRQEERNGGCAYMVHAHEGSYDAKKMPYCSPTEQVKELWQKYKDYQQALPLTAYGTEEGLEYCAICGRPCHGHAHFSLEIPGKIIVSDNYGKCTGGGRPELIARMLAIRAVLLKYKGETDVDNAEIRKEAAFAADAAPLDPALMARAKAIYAKEAKNRRFNNVGLDEYSKPKRSENNSEEKEGEEGDEGSALQFVPREKLARDIVVDLRMHFAGDEQELPEVPPGVDPLTWARALRKYLEYTLYEEIPEGWNPETPLPQLTDEIRRTIIGIIILDITYLLRIGEEDVPEPPEGQDPLEWYESMRLFLEDSPADSAGQRYLPEGWNPGMAPPQPPIAVAAMPPGNAQPAPPINNLAENPLLAALAEQEAPLPAWHQAAAAGNFANNNFIPNNNNLQGGRRRTTRGRRKSAMKKRLRTQRNSRR